MPSPQHICLTLLGDVRYDSRSFKCAKSLQEHRYQVSIVMSGSQSSEFDFEGIHIVTVGLRKWFWSKLYFLEFYLKATIVILRIKAECYFASDLYSLPVAFIAEKVHHAKLVYDAREFYAEIAGLQHRKFEQGAWKSLERFFIKRADRVFTVNHSLARLLAERYPIPQPVVLKNFPAFFTSKKTNVLRSALGGFQILTDKKILLYQGGLQHGRGIFLLLKIIQQFPDCVLVFLGDGILKNEIQQAIQRDELQEKVFLLDAVPVDQLLTYTASADLGLCLIENFGTSYYYSLPNKLFEYIMAGIPVVASDFPEMKKIVETYQVGETANPEKEDEVVARINKILCDKNYYSKLKENCKKAATIFNWESEEKKLLDAIKNL